eukprot:m51a1_g8497 hypothetical protein (425) ;mRNA; f:35146-36857
MKSVKKFVDKTLGKLKKKKKPSDEPHQQQQASSSSGSNAGRLGPDLASHSEAPRPQDPTQQPQQPQQQQAAAAAGTEAPLPKSTWADVVREAAPAPAPAAPEGPCAAPCECCARCFPKSEPPPAEQAKAWQEAFEQQWPFDDNRRWLVDDASQVEDNEQWVAEWRRAGAWFARAFGTGDWKRDCHARLAYDRAVAAAAARGARGFVAASVGDGQEVGRAAMVSFGPGGAAVTSAMLHARFVGAERPGPTLVVSVAAMALFGDVDDLARRLMAGLLDAAGPECACVSVDEGHRYDWLWPHVLQLGAGHVVAAGADSRQVVRANGGTRALVVDGETTLTCAADGSFGVEVVAWGNPCRVVVWGAALVDALLRDPPKSFAGARAERSDGPLPADKRAAAVDRAVAEKAAEAFAHVAPGAANWTIQMV